MKKTKFKSGSRLSRLQGYFFVLPAMLFMAALVFYPIIYNIYISFTDMSVKTLRCGYTFVGLENYKQLLSDSLFLQIIGQTYLFTFLNLILQFFIGFILASFLYRRFPGSGIIRSAMAIPFMVPLSVVSMLFKNMLQTNTTDGVINYLLSSIGLVSPDSPVGWLIDPTSSMWAIVITNCWCGIPFIMMLLITGFSSISPDVLESASIDGATGFKRYWYVILPLLKSSIFSVLTLGFIYTFKVFDIVYIMTKGGPANSTHLLSTIAYRYSFEEFRFSLGSTAAVVLFFCIMLIGIFYLFLIRNEEAS